MNSNVVWIDMNHLTRYETARNALAECRRIDEVKDIRDKAEAMAAYARQAKDTEMIQWATEIKVRAERKAGEMLRDAADRGERATNVGNVNQHTRVSHDTTPTPTLSDIGITRDQSSRWQQLAAMPDEHFETAVATAKDTAGQVTTAFMLRAANSIKPRSRPMKGPKADSIRAQLQVAMERDKSVICSCAKMMIAALQQQDVLSQQEDEFLLKLQAAIAMRAMRNEEAPA
ncbi:hypothetical protein ACN9MU_16595 [Pseudoduganella sp. R-32]|uniref:hypothetical protein n=1 Tax=Pseudoduganella sp. R-32 TaxID=3404061 RepID=UPI003CEE5E90